MLDDDCAYELMKEQVSDKSESTLNYSYPPILLFYKCECGQRCQFHCSNVGATGVRVRCTSCGAITLVPSSIFDPKNNHPC